ncbi:Hypothetical protein A7982_00940 [Minicystis rosea]|nr:Hypothetical protein A7982_00940 [Minicystis rosea]
MAPRLKMALEASRGTIVIERAMGWRAQSRFGARHLAGAALPRPK